MRDKVFYNILIALLFALLIYGLVQRQSAQQDCLDSGGWINEYNCGENGCASWACVHS